MLYYVTGNFHKFKSAQDFLKNQEIEIEQQKLDIPEIQGESIEEIAIDKAKRAYDLVHEPLFVNDSGWIIRALNGFPGPYLKYINEWFSAEDFINLMKGKEDRTVILKQLIVYIDGKTQKVFEHDSRGKILPEVSKYEGRSTDKVISFSQDKSVAEQKAEGTFLLKAEEKLWENFVDWLKSYQST